MADKSHHRERELLVQQPVMGHIPKGIWAKASWRGAHIRILAKNMTINEDTVLNNQVLPLLNIIINTRKKLKELGVIRSEKDILGDYAEWIASREYGLTLAKTGINKTYDATDDKGNTYQIKARRVKSINETTSFDFHNYDKFDFLIIVFINAINLKPLIKSIKIPYGLVKKLWSNNKNSRRFRWNKRTKEIIDKETISPSNNNAQKS